MNNVTEMVITIAMGLIGLAVIAVLVSRNATTVPVIKESWRGFNMGLGTAIAPVTGSSPMGGSFGFNAGFSPSGNMY